MKRIIPIVLLLAAGGSAAWYYYFRPKSDALVLSGSVEARTVEVGSQVGGRIREVHVTEGQAVAAGDPIVTFESDFQDLEIARQQQRIASLSAASRRVEAGPRREAVARARVEWQASQTNLKRYSALFRQGVVSREAYDGAAVAESLARETLREAERGNRPEDKQQATADLKQEAAQLAYLERQRDELVVRSPVAGVVEVFDLRPGDLVGANQPVASLLERDQLWVRVYVPEPKLGLVQVGQKAAIAVDTFPGRAFPGRIVEIRHQAEYTPRNVQTLDQRSDQVFGVKVAIDPSPELKAGMAAFVRLEGLEGLEGLNPASPEAAPARTTRTARR